MKPESVDLRGVCEMSDLVERVVRTRREEVRRLAVSLEDRDKAALHNFRIAAKRLRYALERFADIDPSYRDEAERLALMQDALGEAHDRDVLLSILPPAMAITERRLQSERAEFIDRATALWSGLS